MKHIPETSISDRHYQRPPLSVFGFPREIHLIHQIYAIAIMKYLISSLLALDSESIHFVFDMKMLDKMCRICFQVFYLWHILRYVEIHYTYFLTQYIFLFKYKLFEHS